LPAPHLPIPSPLLVSGLDDTALSLCHVFSGKTRAAAMMDQAIFLLQMIIIRIRMGISLMIMILIHR
jgi:hypothetical protein